MTTTPTPAPTSREAVERLVKYLREEHEDEAAGIVVALLAEKDVAERDRDNILELNGMLDKEIEGLKRQRDMKALALKPAEDAAHEAIARIAELEAALYPFALAFKGGHTGWVMVGMLKRAAQCFPEVVEKKS